MTTNTDKKITNYLRHNYGSGVVKYADKNKLNRDFGSTNLYVVRGKVADILASQGKISSDRATQKVSQLTKNKQGADRRYQQQLLKATTGKNYAVGAKSALMISSALSQTQRELAMKRVLSDLEASNTRTQQAKINDLQRQAFMLEKTFEGRRLLRVINEGQLRTKLKSSPFSENYKREIRATIRSLRPRQKELVGNYGKITVDKVVFIPTTQREANYLKRLKSTIERDNKLKSDWANAARSSGLVVNRDDKWYVKAFKGSGLAGLGLLSSGKFLASATDKLIKGLSGLTVNKNIRTSVVQEAGRAAKATPSAVGKSLDPTKPENWANILMTVIAINSLAKMRLAKTKSLKLEVVRSELSKVNKALSRIRSVKTRASKNPTRNRVFLKKIFNSEKSLLKTRVTLKNLLVKAEKKVFLKGSKLRKQTAKKTQVLQKKASSALKKVASPKGRRLSARKYFSARIKELRVDAKLIKGTKKPKALSEKTLSNLEKKALSLRRREAKIEYDTKLAEAKARATLNKQLAQYKKKYGVGSKTDIKTRRANALKAYNKSVAATKQRAAFAQRQLAGIKRELLADIKRSRLAAKRLGVKLGKVKKSDFTLIVSRLRKMKGFSKINAKVRPSALEVTAGNGKRLLLKTPVSAVKANKGVTTVVVKPVVLRQAKTYYVSVLAVTRRRQALKVPVKEAEVLHDRYSSVFAVGAIKPKLKLGVSAFSIVGSVSGVRKASLTGVKDKGNVGSKVKEDSLVRTGEAVIQRLAVAQKQGLRTDIINRLLERLEQIKQRLKRTRSPKKIKFSRRLKVKLSKKSRDEWDKIYSKVKRQYRPSLAAIVFGIYGYKPKTITGFEIRPILRKRRKR